MDISCSSLLLACAAIGLISARARARLANVTATERALRLELLAQVARLARRSGTGPPCHDHSSAGDGGQSSRTTISLRGRRLSRLTHPLLSTIVPAGSLSSPLMLHTLDLACNQLTTLPTELGALVSLISLDASRNYLKSLPSELGQLLRLETLNVSSNALRISRLSLAALAGLPRLREFDLRHNNKIHDDAHVALLAASLPQLTAGTSGRALVSPRVAFHDREHAADRDGTLLLSQLAPFSTGTLRRRLALVFDEHTNPAEVPREQVLARLVHHYEAAGVAARRVRLVAGAPVSAELCTALLAELEAWAALGIRERPTINAQQYMILSAPSAFAGAVMTTRRARKLAGGGKKRAAARKVEQHGQLWALARRAIEEVDSEFARKYTAVAFTCNFTGSPHIDTQNTGPFYGLALGDFSAGGGALCVEVSAREVAHVDTRGRLARVDGRFPHWVAPYAGTRYSVIFYQAQGDVVPLTTAVFEGEALVDDPPTYCDPKDRYHNCYDPDTNTYSPSDWHRRIV